MSTPGVIRIIEPGMLTTVQDLGRSGHGAIGVARGGAADALCLRLGNRLVGNADAAAALEMTLTGGVFEFTHETVAVVTGGMVHATVEDRQAARPIVRLSPTAIPGGARLRIGPVQTGARAYLCVAGGIDVPPILGSRSTHLGGGFGGLSGRPLRAGDEIRVGSSDRAVADAVIAARARALCDELLSRRALRAVDGMHASTFRTADVERFWGAEFVVSLQSDRTGVRLDGQIGTSTHEGRMPSEGMMHGAVQIPESGMPIVLMADHPTTGGYPVIACVSAVDLCVLGQLRPRDAIRFKRVTVAEARAHYAEQERRLDAEVPPR
ncbi:MAG: KipI antagonist [Nitrospira sp.]|nr:MAG: KipI antagonist [Nitrospira sp.]